MKKSLSEYRSFLVSLISIPVICFEYSEDKRILLSKKELIQKMIPNGKAIKNTVTVKHLMEINSDKQDQALYGQKITQKVYKVSSTCSFMLREPWIAWWSSKFFQKYLHKYKTAANTKISQTFNYKRNDNVDLRC